MRITDRTFDGLAFPIVRVRYAGPTNYRGSRWIATMRRDNERSYRVVTPYDASLSTGTRNAIVAARACWDKARADLGWDGEYIAIPAELDADTYAFTFVFSGILNGERR